MSHLIILKMSMNSELKNFLKSIIDSSEDDPDERARELTKKDKDEINDIFRENELRLNN